MFNKGKSFFRGKVPQNQKHKIAENVEAVETQARFGTFGGVFTPCVLTILGVIMFMRVGYVTGYSGFWWALAILLLSKTITTFTTLSISAIATNLEMQVGGVYFMISRVLGPDFGGAIGITLFIAQAVSVAFYTIGFTEAAFDVLGTSGILSASSIETVNSWHLPQMVSTAVVGGLFYLTFKGADVAIKAQYGVLAVLLLAVASFIIGGILGFDSATFKANSGSSYTEGAKGVSFWVAFAIFFPAATGITAGANMSGDLKNPGRSIPWGTLAAIAFTAIIYGVQLVLTAGYKSSDAAYSLKTAPFAAIQDMSIFGPLIVLGVFAATLSSALGSFLGAPRILQAMGQDRLMKVMVFFGKGSGPMNEPRRATILTFAIAIGVIWAGDLNTVAPIISMFFLIAYGMINLSAFVESKGSNPSFRPRFKYFHWITAGLGAVGCIVAMIKINESYAIVAVFISGIIYFYLRKRDIKTTYGDAKRGFIFQRTRDNLIYLDQSKPHPKNWRPLLVAITEDPRKQSQMVQVGSWIESRRGLYSVAHLIERKDCTLADKINLRKAATEELTRQLDAEGIIAFPAAVAVDDFYQGLSTFLQSYSIGGLRPNTVLVSMPREGTDAANERFLKTIETLAGFNHNLAVLKPSDLSITRKRRTIDLWWRGERNGSLMALLAYLITLDKTWRGANLRILRIVRDETQEAKAILHLEKLKEHTRIDASVRVIKSQDSPKDIILSSSGPVADLVLLGMNAASSDEVKRYMSDNRELLDRMPTTIMIWSNGDSDVFA